MQNFIRQGVSPFMLMAPISLGDLVTGTPGVWLFFDILFYQFSNKK